MPITALCEFVWVSRSAYRRASREIGDVIRTWLVSPTVRLDRPAVEAGLAVLDAGGDFADGVIAFEGRRLGGEVFASFDRQGVQLLADTGSETLLVGSPKS
jgi:predicted nucleic-acid-binding protein